VEPANIAALQRFVTDLEMKEGIKLPKKAAPTGKKVAVIGSGPAGLAAAAELAKSGHGVTIFEAKSLPGGVLTWGIPPYRLPKDVVMAEIEFIKQLGVEIKTDTPIDEKFNIDTIFDQDFDAIFIATGVWKPYFVRMPGEDLEGVYSALELLSQVNVHYSKPSSGKFPLRIGKKALVIGGGNVAMDAACSLLRLGAEEVHVVCLESFEEMPAFPSEIEFAREEGIVFHPRSKPLRIIGNENGRVKGFEGVGIRWKEPNNFSPSNVIPIEGTEFSLEVETVIEAIGQGPDPSLAPILSGIKTKGRGLIVVDEKTYMTSREGVFAGGDIVNGGDTVVQAIAEGKKAAEGIINYLKSKGKK
jgi:glutamate synthase (NADPH/NADH) small chain